MLSEDSGSLGSTTWTDSTAFTGKGNQDGMIAIRTASSSGTVSEYAAVQVAVKGIGDFISQEAVAFFKEL